MASSSERPAYSPAERKDLLKKLKRERIRVKTFKNWSSRTQNPLVLAKAGFFFFNDGDKVQCAFCLRIIGEWERDDDPFAEHKTHFPRCPFVLGLPVGNIKVDLRGQDEAEERRVFPVLDTDLTSSEQQNNDRRDSAEPERGWEYCQKSRIPDQEKYSEIGARLKTFQHWPRGIAQKPKELAEAGLVYSGVGDLTVCFSCGGEIQYWEETDDPWGEHAAQYPHCKYLIESKGRDFVREIQNKTTDLYHIDAKKMMYSDPAMTFLNSGYLYDEVKKVIEECLRKKINPSFLTIQTELFKIKMIVKLEDEKLVIHDPLCKICHERNFSAVLLPCSHLCVCEKCGNNCRACPICKKDVKGYVQPFMS